MGKIQKRDWSYLNLEGIGSKNKEWEIAKPKRQFIKFFKTHPEKTKYIPELEADVTDNPFYHRTPDKIVKLEPQDYYPDDSYRWKKRDLRIVYLPLKKEKLILPLDADTAGGIRYR